MSPTSNLLTRVKGEFIEMPGLKLRVEQAQRLWNLDRTICEMVLRSLVEACTNALHRLDRGRSLAPGLVPSAE